MSLDNIKIVLVEPTHAGNVGGVARAMKNMGLTRLSLVAPVAYRTAEAYARAAGAADVVESAQCYDSLDAAIADCRLVIGTSARDRRIAWPTMTPREAGERLYRDAAESVGALVFGRERTGLTNAELDRCHALVTIPADPEFSSLNLACAVQVMAYELRLASVGNASLVEEAGPAGVMQGELRRFYIHLEEVLVQTEFLDPANPRKLMRRLQRVFNRAQLDQNEVNILRGILTAVQRKLNT